MNIFAYLHLFILHASIWTALLIMIDAHENGLPWTLGSILDMLRSAAILGSVVGILTAHAHGHYLAYIKDVL
jgi:hypothetical protein